MSKHLTLQQAQRRLQKTQEQLDTLIQQRKDTDVRKDKGPLYMKAKALGARCAMLKRIIECKEKAQQSEVNLAMWQCELEAQGHLSDMKDYKTLNVFGNGIRMEINCHGVCRFYGSIIVDDAANVAEIIYAIKDNQVSFSGSMR